ncbi:DUF1127 domain-containing protein [Marinobacterium jannaschii]|uniref:DUF1127 domain-containing protein n=1 Tax=Marinobacterium jannaschii TaxID=64970 RepID=UPI000A05C41D|nr:DUF1127 domain-containing protein [Marinobacterium jannaschii]
MLSSTTCCKAQKNEVSLSLLVSHYGCRIGERVKHWLRNYQSRRQLTRLDSHMLKDIGISRADALREAEKPFWRD